MRKQTVYLVGAGPGDDKLITVRGRELIEKADFIIYDYLANPEHLCHAGDKAVKICVGKGFRYRPLTQNKINRLIVRSAKNGKRVVRLKGGDPYLFGRGGEEALHLFQNKIPFEVVPGITSAMACAAYAGIPLTHRDAASHVTVVAGQNSAMGEEAPEDRWAPYHYLPRKTMVILMGFAQAENIAKRLVSLGWPGDTPAALISCGTYSNQRKKKWMRSAPFSANVPS